MTNDVPRRIRIDQFTPAEKAIYDAQQAVEAMPADVRLTKAGNLLGEARDLVADFVDGINGECCWGVYDIRTDRWWPRAFETQEQAEQHLAFCRGPGTQAEVRRRPQSGAKP